MEYRVKKIMKLHLVIDFNTFAIITNCFMFGNVKKAVLYQFLLKKGRLFNGYYAFGSNQNFH
jgi:hypothetical protein